MNLDNKLVTNADIVDIRNIAFHFSPQRNITSILNEGLKPLIGDNASGGLGQSAIEKVYFSYGLEGVLQLYNRLISASFQQEVGDLNGISHKPFIPDSANDKLPSEHLSMIEGFEMVRQYMEDNVYFVFDAPITQYEHELSDSDLQNINQEITKLTDSGTNIVEKINELNDKIATLSRSRENNKDEIVSLVNERNRLSILVREKTLPMINSIRGNVLNANQNPIVEEVDYNDERLAWINQMKKPHNTHSKIVKIDGKVQGVKITSDILKLFSQDGKNVSNGLDFLDFALSQTTTSDQIYLDSSEKPACHDCNLLFKFQEYLRLVEKYKSNGLLITKPETTYKINDKTVTIPKRQVMDMKNISKYPDLAEFSENLEQYYEDNRYKKTTKALAEEVSDKIIDDIEGKRKVNEEVLRNESEMDKSLSK